MATELLNHQYRRWPLLVLAVLVVLFFLLDIAFGSVNIPIGDVVTILFGGTPAQESWANIVYYKRLPDALTALLAGGGLAVSGLQMQTLFRNPLAGPSVLGITSGASLGVALVILMSGAFGGWLLGELGLAGSLALVVAAFIGSAMVLLVVLTIARRVRDNVTLLIIGLMMGYITSALVSVLSFYSQKEEIQTFVIWGFGSFSDVSWSQMQLFAPVVLLGLGLTIFLIKPMNALLLGEQYATSMGLNVKRTRILIIACTGLLAGTVTAFCGPIAFLGLAVPHLTRSWLNTSNHRMLLPGVILTGMALAISCDLISRLPGVDAVLPINAVTAMIGAPVVIWIIIRQRNLKAVM